MYLTTTISVALVLYLIGMEAVLLLSAHQLIQKVKENVALTVILKDNATTQQINDLDSLFTDAPYCHEACFISKEQALQEHIETLGEDPQKFLGYNPLSNSFEVSLNADYAQQDSIEGIESELANFSYIDKITHPKEIVSLLDMHVGEISLILIIVALLLLFISIALIVNTVRLHVYSKRFIINTMRLVGATPWVIRAPFVKRNVLLGFEAGICALIVIIGTLYYVHSRLGVWLVDLTWSNVLFITLIVLCSGELITLIASFFATDRYVRMKIDKMYEI